MKAVLYYNYGKPEDLLKIENAATPEIKNDEVLVKIKAVGLNPRDINIVEGKLKFVSGKTFPKGIGADFSGVVEKLGAGVTGFAINDSVVGYIDSLNAGALAEYVAVKSSLLSIKPKNINYTSAAAIPCNYLTAWLALITKAKTGNGQSVIIYGASGGVGTAAIQIAKYAGAVVTAVCSKKNVDYCLSQGADTAIAYDEANELFNSGKAYDVFFQVYSDSGLLYNKAKRIITKRGSFVTLIPNPLYAFKKLINLLLGKPAFYYILVKSDQMTLTKLLSLAEDGVINPYISNEFSFDNYKIGLHVLKAGHTIGKTIIYL